MDDQQQKAEMVKRTVNIISKNPPSKDDNVQQYHSNISLIRNVEDKIVFLTAIEDNSFKETKTRISNSYLIRQSFSGYRCESGTVIFAWSVT